ncbi:hypothetical protein CDAR_545501 [Caerostris darwini]|uniref:Uncharacterized protein n=1 Tax=Caerostris darwini TaxID=1538125 RepID=A0AAV4RK01_9ARAC|nr:hypothetical protein CDAR_545501 [Caerostris darwini]
MTSRYGVKKSLCVFNREESLSFRVMDPENSTLTKLIQEMADFKNKFSPIPDARLSTGNSPPQDHLKVPSSGAAEAMITESPMLTEADHCSPDPT